MLKSQVFMLFFPDLQCNIENFSSTSHWIYEVANCDCAIYAQHRPNLTCRSFLDKMAQLYDTETLVTRMLLRGMIEYLTSSTQLDSLFESAEFGHHQ